MMTHSRHLSVRRMLCGLAGVVAVTALSVPAALPASAQTGAPTGGCATGGGWSLDTYAPDNQSAILVDQVYGNSDGWLCVKLPSDHAPYPMIIDNVVPTAGSR